MYWNYFFTALNYQNYYFTVLLVENISCNFVLSMFQIFQLKEDKICNQSHDKVQYFLIIFLNAQNWMVFIIFFQIKVEFVKLKTEVSGRSFIKRQPSGTSSDNKWQRVVQRVTTNDNEWYNKWHLVTTSSTTNDKEWHKWQRMTTSHNEWQRVVQWMKVILGFRMKQLCNAKLQYIQQRLFENIM